MFTHIRTSAENKSVVSDLTHKLGLGPENVIARIAFAYSLSTNKYLSLEKIKDNRGKEYKSNILFGNNLPYYVAMICVHYNVYKSDKNIPRYIKMHLDHGLDLIDQETKKNPNIVGFDFITNKIESGLKFI